MGQRKGLGKHGASETSFSLMPQGSLGSTGCATDVVHLEVRGWTFVYSASWSLAEVLPFLDMFGD